MHIIDDHSKSRSAPFFTACASVFLALVLWKTRHMGFTFDEAYSFVHHAQWSLADIFLYKGDLPANNHLFNTLSMKLFSGIFGISEGILRITSTVGAVLYVRGAALLTRFFGKRYTPLYYLTPILFFTNPHVFDFLVVARGYSLSLGCSMLGLYYFLQTMFVQDTTKNIWYVFLFLSLATISNLAFLNLYLGVLAVYAMYRGIVLLQKRKYEMVLVRIGMLLVSGWVLGSIYLIAINAMKAADDLRFGGYIWILEDTYTSLITSYMYESTGLVFKRVLVGACCIVVGVWVWWSIVSLVTRQTRRYKLIVVCLSLFAVVSCSLIVQHSLFWTPYLIARTALFFYGVFYLVVLSVCALMSDLLGRRFHAIVYGMYGAVMALLASHFASTLNFSYVPVRKFDMHTREVIEKIPEHTVLGVERILEPTAQFYLLKNASTSIAEYNSSNEWKPTDYYYVTQNNYEQRTKDGEELEVVEEFPDAETVLLRTIKNPSK